MLRFLLAVATGWLAGLGALAVVFGLLVLASALGIGPFATFLGEFMQAHAISRQSAMSFMISDRALELGRHTVSIYIWGGLPIACLVATLVATRVRGEARGRYWLVVLASALPIAAVAVRLSALAPISAALGSVAGLAVAIGTSRLAAAGRESVSG